MITLLYGDRSLPAEPGARLLDVILNEGIDHRHLCGGNGFCTSCRVEVVGSSHGLSKVSPLERERLGWLAGQVRLACQTRIYGNTTVRVPRPVSSRFSPDGDE